MSIGEKAKKLTSQAEQGEAFEALQEFPVAAMRRANGDPPRAGRWGWSRPGCFVPLRWVAFLMLVFVPAVAQEKPAGSLYERVGRYDGISAIADEYLKGIRSDPQLARFSGRGADSLRRARQLLKDQLCALAGGPCTYVGRDMKTVHGGLGITAQEWAVNMKHMAAALDQVRIVAQEKDEFLAVVDALAPDIVEEP